MYMSTYVPRLQRTENDPLKVYLKIVVAVISIVLTLSFTFFVILPLIFKNSIKVQQRIIFNQDLNADPVPHSNFDKSNVKKKIINGYLNVKDDLKIGFWNVSDVDSNGEKPTLIHFHDENNDRLAYQNFYLNYTSSFNVIAFDYRNYGDSSKYDLVEDGLVDDAVYIYKWVLNRTKQDIYVWGDGLGATIATHTVSRLRKDGIIPAGLILENSLKSVSEWFPYLYYPLKWVDLKSPIGSLLQLWSYIFSRMPWYDIFITKPLMENGLSFNISKYIPYVNCPIFFVSSPSNVGWKKYRVYTVNDARDALSQDSVVVNYGAWGSMISDKTYSTHNNKFNNLMTKWSTFKRNHHN